MKKLKSTNASSSGFFGCGCGWDYVSSSLSAVMLVCFLLSCPILLPSSVSSCSLPAHHPLWFMPSLPSPSPLALGWLGWMTHLRNVTLAKPTVSESAADLEGFIQLLGQEKELVF